jgi:phospholipid/cholesterol/gamma-HCH transport system substrate-binding protein
MKFRIRFADQIVGICVIVALAAIVTVIFMLGKQQRWFNQNFYYTAYFESAAGLGENMSIQYKGFTIGKVKSFKLMPDDRVEVIFYLFDNYNYQAKLGSLVDVSISPIGLGNQFRFYPGLVERPLAEWDVIPTPGSVEGRRLIQSGIASVPASDDSIAVLLSRVTTTMEDVDRVLITVNEALQGTDTSTLGRTLSGVESALASVSETVNGTLSSVQASVQPILDDVKTLSGQVSDPHGLIATTLAGKGDVYTNLVASLQAVAGTLRSVERTTNILPSQVPGLIAELRTIIAGAENTITALNNNPLLKGGIPAQVQVQSSGTNPRNIAF